MKKIIDSGGVVTRMTEFRVPLPREARVRAFELKEIPSGIDNKLGIS